MPDVSFTKPMLDAIKAALIAQWGDASGESTNPIEDAKHFVYKLPWDFPDEEQGGNLPGVFIVPVPEIVQDATNAADDYGYGAQITIAQASNRDLTENADRLFWWRETAMGLFLNKRLTVGSNVAHKCTIEPKPVIDPAPFRNMVDATAFVVRVWTRKQRPS